MLKSGIPIGRIFGIPLRLHFSWFFIFALVTWALVASYFPDVYPNWSLTASIITGILTSLLFFGSVLLHELMHSVVAIASGIPVKSITLFIFGGVSQITEEPTNPKIELKIAIAGPLTSIILGGFFWAIFYFVPGSLEYIIAVSFWLGLINIMLGAFNLLPGFPLDGGRVLRSLLWWRTGNLRRATRWASNAGRGISFLFIFGGIWLIFQGPEWWFNGLWLAFIGWFLGNAAVGSYRQLTLQQMLQGHEVNEAMTRSCINIQPNITLDELVSEYILPTGNQCFVVVDRGNIQGLITLKEIKEIPRVKWAKKQASEVMVPLTELRQVSPHEDLARVMKMLTEEEINQLPVVEDEKIIGMISRENMLTFINLRDKLGM
ncbi:MAG: site-2 protease family protein [Dehalococcoidia bacterium]|nr:MAG: site-2 protease family protein [Dehalococcoidia bacterium]